MGGLAHVIESAGVPTTQISLVRPHTEKTRPPRALWVPYELGRPLGAPNDAAFQTRVLRAALALLERGDGPVILEDYPEEAPADLAEADSEGWACPVSLPPPPVDLAAGAGYRAAMHEEVQRLTPWYDMAVREHGRTTVGLSGLEMPAAVDFVCAFLDGEVPANPRDDLSLAEVLKFAVDDLKAFYREAALAQPGANTGEAMNDWFYGETATGRALYALKPVATALAERLDDGFMATFGRALLIPHSQRHRAQQGGG